MDTKLTEFARTASFSDSVELRKGLVDAIVEVSGDPMTVRVAKDGLSSVLAKAKDGTAQLIGRQTDELGVVLSVADLVELIKSASHPLSFGEALEASGFKPANRKLSKRREKPRQRPSWRGSAEKDERKAFPI